MVHEKTLEELKEYRLEETRERIPTFGEVLALGKRGARLW